tara:strand:- start:4483 stop:4611 length:129 start_codon:yes stop_codon:yes gene_type:complete
MAWLKNLNDSGEEDVICISPIFSLAQLINKTMKIKIKSFFLL